MKDRVEAKARIGGLVWAIAIREVGLRKHTESETEIKQGRSVALSNVWSQETLQEQLNKV